MSPLRWSFALISLVALATATPAQHLFGELGKRHLPTKVTSAVSTATADTDSDGDLDLVVVGGGTSLLYRNFGDGRFEDITGSHFPSASDQTVAVAAGDIDGDGDVDIVECKAIASLGPNRLHLNDGTGHFVDGTIGRMPQQNFTSRALAMGDLDGDGDLDIVLANNGDGTGRQNQLFLNTNGVFVNAPGRLPLDQDATEAVALGDVDADGDLDIAFGNTFSFGGSSQTRLHLNNGAGLFTDVTASRLPFSTEFAFSLALFDADGDGDPDLVLGGTRCRLYSNNGAGSFSDTSVTSMPVNTSMRVVSIGAGDIDADGDGDLVLVNVPSLVTSNRVYLNDGTSIFTDATASRLPGTHTLSSSVALADLDEDGDRDVLIAGSPACQLYLNDASGHFIDAAQPEDIVGQTVNMTMGDVDGDNDPDLVLANLQSSLYRNDSRGNFGVASPSGLPSLSGFAPFALADVDGDGDRDLIQAVDGQQNRLFLNNGAGTFTDATSQLPVDADATRGVLVADLDGDGDHDILFGSFNQRVRCYRNNGTGTFVDDTATTLPVTLVAVSAMGVGDIDADGDLDLVSGQPGTPTRLCENNGSGVFTDVTATRMPALSHVTAAIAFADVDADGDLDIALGNAGPDALYLNNGATFTDATAARLPTDNDANTSLAAFDVDGDGDIDLVAGINHPLSSNSPACRLSLNDGSGTFADASTTHLPFIEGLSLGMVAQDVDGNSTVDLAVGLNVGIPRSSVRVYQNLQRAIDAPYLCRLGHDYQLDLYARGGPLRLADVALPYYSMQPAHISFPPLGIIGVDVNTMVALPIAFIPQPLGRASVNVQVPNSAFLLGTPVYIQALLVQAPAQQLLTNTIADIIVR